MRRDPRLFVAALAAGVLQVVAGCGGGDGGSPGPGPGGVRTTFRGNLLPSGAPGLLAPASPSASQQHLGGVQVCVLGTDFCTFTDADGIFTLTAEVSGDLTLVFEGLDFTARLRLENVPPGATVRIDDIRCSVATGICAAEGTEILGNLPPICDDAVARPAIVFPPNHDLQRIAIDGVFDPDGDQLVLFVVSVLQDEPVREPGQGSGNTSPDAFVDPLSVRAERDGTGNGRVYRIDFTVEDGRGGACSGTVQVCVPHDQGQGDTCFDDGPTYDSTNA